jgi:hypothetical protein
MTLRGPTLVQNVNAVICEKLIFSGTSNQGARHTALLKDHINVPSVAFAVNTPRS